MSAKMFFSFLQKKVQDELKKRESEVKFFKRRNNEYEEILNRYKIQTGDLSGLSFTSQSDTEVWRRGFY
jgi:hypothetical protein